LSEAGQEVPAELQEMAEKYQRWKERDAEAKKSGIGPSFFTQPVCVCGGDLLVQHF
jgi:hypothetical protein